MFWRGAFLHKFDILFIYFHCSITYIHFTVNFRRFVVIFIKDLKEIKVIFHFFSFLEVNNVSNNFNVVESKEKFVLSINENVSIFL